MRLPLATLLLSTLLACHAEKAETDGGDGTSEADTGLGATDSGTPDDTDSPDSGTPDDTECTLGEWGEETDCPPEYFAAADVGQEQIGLIESAHETASTAWGNFGPLEYWVVGTDTEAAEALDIYFCSLRMEKDPSLPDDYEDYCLGRGYSFVDYVRDGGAGLNTRHNEDEEYSVFLITMASKYPFPDETDYTVVSYHEYFHVVQSAHIASRDEAEQRSLMVENPWWSEGGAEYMAQLLYSRQPGVDSGYLKERMGWKMESKSMLEDGERFSDIPYGERGRIGYDLGAWFIAYLIHQVGEDAYQVGFFDDLNTLGWEGAFVENFGMSSAVMLDEFEVFLTTPLSEQIAIIP
jgi:hypothetical protein